MPLEFDDDIELDNISDEKLEAIANAKRHKQLMATLNKLIEVTKNDNDTKISDAIGKNGSEIKDLVQKVSDLINKEIKAPEVTVNTDSKPLIEAIEGFNKIGKDIIDGQDAILKALNVRATRMNINRNYGNLTHVDIKYDKIQ